MSKRFPVDQEQAKTLVEKLYHDTSNEEPGPALDAVILNQATRALDSDAKEYGSEQDNQVRSLTARILSWQKPVSIAAMFVMVVTIGMLYKDNESALVPESPMIIQEKPLSIATDSVQPDAFETIADDVAEAESAVEIMEEAAVMRMESAADAPAPLRKQEQRKSAERVMGAMSDQEMDMASDAAPVPAMEEPVLRESIVPAKAKKAMKEKTNTAVMPELKTQQRSMMKAVPFAAPVKTKAQWFEEINEALQSQDLDRAKALWASCQQQYPEAELPKDLLRLFGDDFQGGQPK